MTVEANGDIHVNIQQEFKILAELVVPMLDERSSVRTILFYVQCRRKMNRRENIEGTCVIESYGSSFSELIFIDWIPSHE